VVETSTDAALPNQLVEAKRAELAGGLALFRDDLAALLPEIFPVVISRFKGVDATGKPVPRPGGPIASRVTAITVVAPLGTRVSRIR
jgi:hypothetical protein